MSTQERTETPLGLTNYKSHQALIDNGQLTELRGWWNAATECRTKWKGNASEYARHAAADSEATSKGKRRPHSLATIRQYIGPMMKAQKAGFRLSQFDSIDDVRDEMKSDKKSNKKAKTRREEVSSFIATLSTVELEFAIAEAKRELAAKRKRK